MLMNTLDNAFCQLTALSLQLRIQRAVGVCCNAPKIQCITLPLSKTFVGQPVAIILLHLMKQTYASTNVLNLILE
jgi:hypothetical protein